MSAHLKEQLSYSGSSQTPHSTLATPVRLAADKNTTVMGRESINRDAERKESSTPLAVIGKHAPVGAHTVSSQFASAISTFCFYPFDVLRTRYMSQDGTRQRQHNGQTYNSLFRSFKTIYREEGPRILFRGCGVAVGGSVLAWGLFMSVYRALCNATESTNYLTRSLISILASGISSLISSPIFLVKSRMQLEEATKTAHYNTFRGGVRHVVSTCGVRGLWRGVSLQLLLIFPNALGIPTYDLLKSFVLHYKLRHGASPQEDLNVMEVCVCSAITKSLLLLLSHPMVMLRTRIQDQRALSGERQYKKVLQSARLVLATQGITGMYRGFHLALLHSLPRSLFYYVAYEKSLYVLSKWQ